MIEAPPPPADGKRPVAFYDTECFPNFWLLKIRPRGQQTYTFRLYAGQAFNAEDVRRIILLFDAYCCVSFNGNHYDVPMITAALAGFTAEQLKWLNDEIILNQKKPWELNLPEWKPSDHIDVIEVAPGPRTSQKQYAGRIHYKTMRDLPYEPGMHLTATMVEEVETYCDNDLGVLEAIFDTLATQIHQRELLSVRYGMDLRSKSDAQLAEAVLKKRCEQITGRRIYKPEIDWNHRFRYKVPDYIGFDMPQLQGMLQLIRDAIFGLDAKGAVAMPPALAGLEIEVKPGGPRYSLGIGGLHSQESCITRRSDDFYILRDHDVAAYYPSLMMNAGAWPPALGQTFLQEYAVIKAERMAAKERQAQLKKAGDTKSAAYMEAYVGNEGGKIMINGTFGKTGSPYSVLFAPEMMIQTTITGQLSLLMLIEAHEMHNIPIVSANTDGIVALCPRNMIATSDALIKNWQKRTGLEMETVEYKAIHSRDVNNYFAVKSDGEVKRKGEYSKSGMVEKKNPDVEICADAVAEYLARGTPYQYTIAVCRDITKFITVQKVSGGGVKMWGEGPRKDTKVRDMKPTLEACGWLPEGRKWKREVASGIETVSDATTAYRACFAPQRPEYLGKVVRWYYGTKSPGPIVYQTNGNTVGLSYGARPAMVLPDVFPDDVDYQWYIDKAEGMLKDVGVMV